MKNRCLELRKHRGGACLAKASIVPGEKKQHHRKPWRNISRPCRKYGQSLSQRGRGLISPQCYYLLIHWPKVQLRAPALTGLRSGPLLLPTPHIWSTRNLNPHWEHPSTNQGGKCVQWWVGVGSSWLPRPGCYIFRSFASLLLNTVIIKN